MYTVIPMYTVLLTGVIVKKILSFLTAIGYSWLLAPVVINATAYYLQFVNSLSIITMSFILTREYLSFNDQLYSALAFFCVAKPVF